MPTDENETHLQPCPFCGRDDLLGFTSNADDNYSVLCECGGEGPGGENEAEAARLWNMRLEER